ncbi:Rac-binding component of scar regulatory complex [Histomonas meleagridis]|uniref:Rac-binding component of scar regulatory complex n=1 Tax=Histomonas meleagridis TaxID=135588 RepID=UPI003559EC5F|nr:Rac-binding component of scar regulatory complex [Histomonas meleagridis]KAH0800734.1 Rac-binding component of scar regulatory complex [Histomonas meleagridis]
MSTGVILPEQAQVQQWNDLTELPIIGTIPRSVPLTTMITSPTEDEYEYRNAQMTKLVATDSIMLLTIVESRIKTVEEQIAFIYPLRSTTRGLEEALAQSKAPQDKINPIATQMLKDMVNNFNKVRSNCNEVNNQISAIFHQRDFWSKGLYSNIFLDKLFYLISRLFTLGKLCPTRTALSDDLSTLHKIIKPQNRDLIPMDLRMWMNTPNAIKMDLLDKLKDIPYELTNHIFNIFYHRICEILNEERYIYPDMETACIVSLLFIVDFWTKRQQAELADKSVKKKVLKALPNTLSPLIHKERVKHPALVLVYEFGVDFDQFVMVANNITQSLGEKSRPKFNLFETMTELQDNFTVVSQVISRLTSNDNPSKDLVEKIITLLPKTFQLLGKSIHELAELIIDKHDHAPPAPKTEEQEQEQEQDQNKLPPSKFELAMRYGLTDDEREYIMEILALNRSFKEMITSDLPRLNSIIANYVQEEVQKFIKIDLESSLLKLSGKNKEHIGPDLENIRVLMGYFKNNNELTPKQRSSKEPPLPTDDAHSPPHIQYLQLLRSEIQILLNSENSSLDRTSTTLFTKFQAKSEFYIDILQLEKTLTKVCDQSSLFFKEFFLDMYRGEVKKISKEGAVHFPITSSLPYVLIDYALSHPEKLELIGSLYYPLSIYDDAASTALKHLNSRYLFEEIRAEAEICLLTISKMIADFAFEKLRNFYMQRFVDQNDGDLLKKPIEKNENVLRLVNILQQNQLFLLGNYIDIKSLFVSRLNEMFFQNVSSIYKIIQSYGLLGIVVFSNVLTILKEVHSAFVNCGLILTPFNDIVSALTRSGSAGSFNSLILDNIKSHMIKQLVPRFFLHTNPHRLVPPIAIGENILNFLKSKKNLVPTALRQTTLFITVEHFRELLNFIDTGSVVLILEELKSYVKQLIDQFVPIYKEIQGKLRRITNIPIGTECHKAYDRFEGAYRSFMNEKQIDQLFETMKSIGNAIAISEMLDYAFSLKRGSSQQVLAYIYQTKPDNIDEKYDLFFELFDRQFADSKSCFNNINVVPNKGEISPPFMQSIVLELTNVCKDKWELFDETSTNIYDFPSLTGFAAIWSVLEFVFCLKEVYRKEGVSAEEESGRKVNRGAFAQFGEGVIICATAILCATRQQRLSQVLSIGGRINQMKKTDLAILEEETMTRFLSVNQLVHESMEFSMHLIEPAIESIFNAKK